MAELKTSPLTTLAGITAGRRMKLGSTPITAMDCAPTVLSGLPLNGYKGDITVLDTGYCGIPAGARGIVTSLADDMATLAFIWRDGDKIRSRAATVTAGQLVTSRGASPMAGEPTPLTQQMGDSMLARLTGTQPQDDDAEDDDAPAPQPQKPMAAAAQRSGAVAGSLDAIIEAIVDSRVNDRLAVIEQRIAAEPQSRTVHVRVNEQPPRELGTDTPHQCFADIFRRAMLKNHRGFRVHQALVGPAGTGKSTIVEHVAAALGVQYEYVNCSAGMSESRLIGRMTPNLSTGEESWTATPYVRCFRDGGVFLLDEADAADANVMLTLNGMMEADFWTAPDGTRIPRHPDWRLFAAMNTYGSGADRVYAGRNQLDGAFMNRWLVTTVGYDEGLEASLTVTKGLAARIQTARAKMETLKMRRWLTPRDTFRADMLVQQLDYTVPQALAAVTDGWTAEERTRVGL